MSSLQFGFPKSSRLLNRKDFRFRPYHRLQTRFFQIFFTDRGTGRLGISISKKVLKNAVSRNRVRRLFKEAFRMNYTRFQNFDLHVVGLSPLTESALDLTLSQVEAEIFMVLEGRRA